MAGVTDFALREPQAALSLSKGGLAFAGGGFWGLVAFGGEADGVSVDFAR